MMQLWPKFLKLTGYQMYAFGMQEHSYNNWGLEDNCQN